MAPLINFLIWSQISREPLKADIVQESHASMWHTQPTVLGKPQLSSPRSTRPGVLSLGCHAKRIASSVEPSMFIASVSCSLNAYDLPH